MNIWVGILMLGLGSAELVVGLTVLRRVTRIVRDSGKAVEKATVEGIERAKTEAVGQFTAAVGPALSAISTAVPDLLRSVLSEHIRVTGGATVEVTSGETTTKLRAVEDG